MNKILIKVTVLIFLVSSTCTVMALNTNGNCENVSGKWNGFGEVKLFILSCGYDAVVQVSEGNPANASITVTKSSGSFLCPRQTTYDVSAKCDDGNVVIKDDVIDVIGKLSTDNTQLDIEGTVYAMYKKHPIKLSLDKN